MTVLIHVFVLARHVLMIAGTGHSPGSAQERHNKRSEIGGDSALIQWSDLRLGELLGKGACTLTSYYQSLCSDRASLAIARLTQAAGYFAEVRKGEWRGIKVAVKIIYRESFRKKNDLALFEQEAQILAYPSLLSRLLCLCLPKKKKKNIH